ncbi:MAG: S41 family peptidase [Phycisphaerales bacterium]
MQQRTRFGTLLLAVIVGFVLVQQALAIAGRSSDYEWFDPIIVVRTVLLDHFVREPDEAELVKMQEAMIAAMVESLGDPYTEYVPARAQGDFDKRLRGTYVGIGAEINIVDGWLTIVSPMDDSPALEAGVRAGDTVLDIEGQTTFEMTTEEAISLLTGEPGTRVNIKVRHRDGTEEALTVTRRRIVTRTVKGVMRDGQDWEYRIDPDLGIGYVRITQFTSTTAADVRNAIAHVQDTYGLRGLIVDVRFDPGGELPSAIEISDLFLQQGTIVSVKGRSDRDEVYKAHAAGTLPEFPMVVLVNESSASASEIVAGALQENGRAKVVGERSFGKGSVQEVRVLPGNFGTLKVTAAGYYLPSGRSLHRESDSVVWGVDPDDGYHIDMDFEQYQHMVDARRRFEIIDEVGNDEATARWSEPTWIRDEIGDLQLAGALEALQARLRDGVWKETGGPAGDRVALTDELREAMQSRTIAAETLQNAHRRVLELRDVASEAQPASLLPEAADLEDGFVTVTNAAGEVIGRFQIRDRKSLELALEFADVTPAPTEEP